MKKSTQPTILVTDDTEESRYMVSRHLRKAGFAILEASTGQEAIQQSEKQPSLILLDIKLPDMTGFEVCKKIKSNPVTSAIPVIHISSTFQGIQDKVQGLEGGADGYLTTPIEAEELIATVNAFLRIRQAEVKSQMAQKRLALAQKAARIGTFEWDVVSDHFDSTAELEMVYGVDPGAMGSTRDTWLQLIHPEDRARVEQELDLALQRFDEFQLEFRVLQPTGESKWILCRAEVVRDDLGKPTRIIGVNIDITERKQDEERLHEAQRQLRGYADELEKRVKERTAKLEETIHDLEAFSYSVSHDLRAPLRAMQGYSDYLLSEYAPKLEAEASGLLARISTASKRLDHMVQDILMYSRTTRAEVNMEPVNLEKLIWEILQQYPEFQASKVRIDIKSPLMKVTGQKSFLTQCVSNIVGNAMKFVDPNTVPHIQIWTEKVAGKVRVSFKDNGIGIAKEHQSRLFKMFERVHPADAFEGNGIGLAVLKKAVERMGGEVGFESEFGRGSVFWFQLPPA